MVASIAIGGFTLAGIAFLMFVQTYGRSNNRPAKELTQNAEDLNGEKSKTNPKDPANAKPNEVHPALNNAQNGTREGQSDSDVGDNSGDLSPDNSEKQSGTPATNVEDTSKTTNPPIPDPNLFPNANVANTDRENKGNAEVTETNPAVDGGQPPTDAAANAINDDNLPSIFKDFQQMFDAPSRSNWDDVGKADRTIENEVAVENAEVLFREEYFPPAIAIPLWAERSERKLTIKSKPMPLLRCIDSFSKLTNAGVTVDWFDLNLAGVDLTENVVIEGTNESVGTILQRICQERGLELVVDNEGFPHVRPSLDRILDRLAPGGDLDPTKGIAALPPEQRDLWVPMVIRLLDLSGAIWKDGQLTWVEHASHYEKARFAASLQVLRESVDTSLVPAKDANDPFDFARSNAWWLVKGKLQAKLPMSQIVYEDRPVMDLLAASAQAAQVELVYDWPAIWNHGFHPARMSISVLRGRTLEEVANRYLEDYALELVPLDSRTLLLTTDAVRRSIERVVPVSLDRGMNIDDIKVAIRGLVPRGADQKSRFRWEPIPGQDQRALLRLCLPSLTQLRDTELQKALGGE